MILVAAIVPKGRLSFAWNSSLSLKEHRHHFLLLILMGLVVFVNLLGSRCVCWEGYVWKQLWIYELEYSKVDPNQGRLWELCVLVEIRRSGEYRFLEKNCSVVITREMSNFWKLCMLGGYGGKLTGFVVESQLVLGWTFWIMGVHSLYWFFWGGCDLKGGGESWWFLRVFGPLSSTIRIQASCPDRCWQRWRRGWV